MQIILNINDKNKANLLVEYLKTLDYITSINQAEESEIIEIPEWHKDIVNERIKTSNAGSFKPWMNAKKSLKN